MSYWVVTGGAGFIGSHLATHLVAEGKRVRVLDNLATGKKSNLDAVADRIEFVEGDVTDPAAVKAAAAGAEVVFHLAAMVSVPQSVAEPMRCHDICATGTLRTLLAAKEAGARRVVYAASSSAYGEVGAGPIPETSPPQTISPYAAAKLAGEHYCSAIAATSSLETVRLRFFNVFGPRQDPSSPYSGVISIFTMALLAGRRPTIFGDGLQTRDFVYVGDVVQALVKASKAPGVAGRVFNVGRGEAITLVQLLEHLNAAAGTNIEATFDEARSGDIRHSCADIRGAREQLGYVPSPSLHDGFVACVDYYRGLAA